MTDGSAAPDRARGASMPVWLLTAVLGTAAAIMFVALGHRGAPLPGHPAAGAVVAALCALSELFVVHVEFRRNAHSFVLSEIPFVVGLFLLPAREVVLAQVAGAAVGLIGDRQTVPLKFVFNLSNYALGASVSALLFHTFAPGGDVLGARWWLLTGAAVLAGSLVTSMSIVLVISFSEGLAEWRRLVTTFAISSFVTLTNAALGLVAFVLFVTRPEAEFLLVAPVLVVLASYRAYANEREQRHSLSFLRETSRRLNEAPDLAAALVELLESARATFRADTAEIAFRPPGQHRIVLRTSVGPGSRRDVMQPVPFERVAGAWERYAFDRAPRLLSSTRELPMPTTGEEGHRDAMLAVLRSDVEMVGTMIVADRLGDTSTFDQQDLSLFDTLANRVAVEIQMGHLEETLARLRDAEAQLTHQAFHDPLTGLPNRALFYERVSDALGRRLTGDGEVAVAFVDLDDFKIVNDSYGHESGDRLLCTVADRLRGCLRPGDTAARLGGDEFALVLPIGADADAAQAIAARVIDSLNQPIVVDGNHFRVGASIGIATSGDDTTAVDDLLRRADLAMYEAKARGKGMVQAFKPEMHRSVSRRDDARRALEEAYQAGGIVPFFQPVVDLASGTPVAIEALLRWNHPERGIVTPDAFLSVAEETGLLVPIGAYALRSACVALARLRRRFPHLDELAVLVNVSLRELDADGFARRALTALDAERIDPSHLVLEVTESAEMARAERALATLDELQGLGVRIALDRFGTGGGPLRALAEMHLDVVKVPKPLVDHVTTARGERLVGGIVQLAVGLDLEPIAVGIEQPAQVSALQRVGVRLGQGLHYAPALPADALERYFDVLVRPGALRRPAADRRIA